MIVSNRENARDLLESADARVDDMPAESYSATTALIGTGYALLDIADAIREQTAKQIPLADLETVLVRAAAAIDGLDEPQHAAAEPA